METDQERQARYDREEKAEARNSFQIQTVRNGEDDEGEALSVAKVEKRVELWIETPDGEAATALTQKMFETLVAKTRAMMNWKAPTND